MAVDLKAAKEFQFTHPVWGATAMLEKDKIQANVSIHAPRVGCDRLTRLTLRVCYVSIHAPRVGCDLTLI